MTLQPRRRYHNHTTGEHVLILYRVDYDAPRPPEYRCLVVYSPGGSLSLKVGEFYNVLDEVATTQGYELVSGTRNALTELRAVVKAMRTEVDPELDPDGEWDLYRLPDYALAVVILFDIIDGGNGDGDGL